MGAYISSLIWDPPADASKTPATTSEQSKYKSGGVSSSSSSAMASSSAAAKPKTAATAAGKKKPRPKGKINRDMIGKPANFQHTGHVGAGDMRGAVDVR